MADVYECLRCGQTGTEVGDIMGVFGKKLVFGDTDDFSFHKQYGGGYLCGTCAMDEVSPMQLDEYGYRRIALGDGVNKYVRDEMEPSGFAKTMDQIPREYRWARMESIQDFKIREKLTAWMSGNVGQCLILGDGRSIAWAVFRKCLQDWVSAMFMPHRSMMVRFREEEEQAKTYHNSPTVLKAKREPGFLILENVLGPFINQGRAEWIGSILDQRNGFDRKTLLTIHPGASTFPKALVSRMTYGTVIPVDDWGRGFLSVKAG